MKRGDVGKDFEEKEQTSREGRREGRERRDKVDSLGQDPSRQISGTGPFLTDDPRRPLLFYSLTSIIRLQFPQCTPSFVFTHPYVLLYFFLNSPNHLFSYRRH